MILPTGSYVRLLSHKRNIGKGIAVLNNMVAERDDVPVEQPTQTHCELFHQRIYKYSDGTAHSKQHRSKGLQPNGFPCANNNCSTRYEQSFRHNKIHTLIRCVDMTKQSSDRMMINGITYFVALMLSTWYRLNGIIGVLR